MSAISIKKGPIQFAGLLFKPSTLLGSSSKSPALVVIHPGGGVMEQTASLYAKKLAQEGFTAVCFDASHQGESGRELHFLEDPSQRVSDALLTTSNNSILSTLIRLVSSASAPEEVTPWQPPRQITA
jgi:fermentation-respiration switch protein FrsA (DUF1100 family)